MSNNEQSEKEFEAAKSGVSNAYEQYRSELAAIEREYQANVQTLSNVRNQQIASASRKYQQRTIAALQAA